MFRPGLAWIPRLWLGLYRLWLSQILSRAKGNGLGLAPAWPGPSRGFHNSMMNTYMYAMSMYLI